ncbi:MAG: hypothetical protein P8Y24_04555 [Gammaproteobacteria bacterium]
MDFAQVRAENEQRLSGELDELSTAVNQSVLEPFARAYLGMFYEIDNDLSCDERVELLANPEIAKAVLKGFENTVLNITLPTPAEIAEKLARGEEYGIGYVVLAGMDRLNKQERLSDLSNATLQSALCFNYSNHNAHYHDWLEQLLADSNIAIPAFTGFWQVLMENDIHLLPGMKKLLLEDKREGYARALSLPVLQNWQVCRTKLLKPLLQQALLHADHQQLLIIAREKIEQEKLFDENQRVLWMACAFLLAPDIFEQTLANYIGRLKQKVLPLLDFIMDTFKVQKDQRVISASAIAQLLRIIAPIFPPQFHSYEQARVLDVNSQNVMALFHKLASFPEEEKAGAIKILRKARVLKIYKKVIDFCDKPGVDIQAGNGFRQFLKYVIENELIVEKSNRFDSPH